MTSTSAKARAENAKKRQGFKTRAARRSFHGGLPDLDLSFLFCPFWDFPDFSGIFPICSGTLRVFFSICPFPLSRPINSTNEEQSRKGPQHNPDLSRKKVGNPPVWKPPGLASLKYGAMRGAMRCERRCVLNTKWRCDATQKCWRCAFSLPSSSAMRSHDAKTLAMRCRDAGHSGGQQFHVFWSSETPWLLGKIHRKPPQIVNSKGLLMVVSKRWFEFCLHIEFRYPLLTSI